jgi:hypothetical protein
MSVIGASGPVGPFYQLSAFKLHKRTPIPLPEY